MKEARVFYSKKGRIKYISHLDMQRMMQRLLTRSGLPIWHTQGYNPHVYVTFALPTPLGFESECECIDFKLTEEVSAEEIIEKLVCKMPADIKIFCACEPVNKVDEIMWADYEISILVDALGKTELEALLNTFQAQGQVLITKKTKTAEFEIDAMGMFCILKSEACDGELKLLMRSAAGGKQNINPLLIIQKMFDGVNFEPDCVQVIKKRLIMANLNNFI